MNINAERTHNAFTQVSDKMEYLTRQVHEYVLLSGFLETHSKAIMKSVDQIAGKYDELLVQSFAGKLSQRLPELRMGLPLIDHEKARARLIAGALITQVLIDNETYRVDKRVESTTTEGHKKFHTRLYMQLGGSFEKDLLRGIEDKPGVVNQKEVHGWKLNAKEKAFLRRVASIPLKVSEVCTKELLLKGYSLKTDWGKKVDSKGRDLAEDPIMRKLRYGIYAETILNEVATKEAFYLPMKYCGRDRMYYEAAVLEGIRPHGKLWETLMIDAAVPFDLTEEDERVLKHLIYVTLHGRVSVDEANAKFSLEDLLNAQMIDPMEQSDEASFGEAILLNKAYQAIVEYRTGQLSRFMFGYDFTNSGLLMSGVSFRSEEMMLAGNIGGLSEVVDSHTAFGEAYDLELERKDVKTIHMGLMHGSALGSIARTLTETTGTEITLEQVVESNRKAYGEPVANIPLIAEWGTQIVGNEQHVLRWTLPDGFSAASRAYYKSVPVMVYCASASHSQGYTSSVMVSDMPWMEDKNGFPVYGKEMVVGGVTYEVEQKKRGLYASITHGVDAYMLRNIADAVLSTGRPMLLKHDDFIVPPSAYEVVKEAAKGVFMEMFQDNLYQQAVNEIAEMSPYELEPLELIVGKGDIGNIQKSENFLMP